MKINTAALALLATTAAAVPMGASDMIGRQVTTVETTTTSSKTIATASPSSSGDEAEFGACVMPTGCRDESKHDSAWRPRTTTLDRGELFTSLFGHLLPTATSSAKGIFSVDPVAEPTSA